MFKTLTGAVLAIAGFAGLAMQAAPASAMPMFDPAPAVIGQSAPAVAPEQAHFYYGYGHPHFYGPRFYPHYHHRFFRPYGGWHRHRHFGFYHPYGWHHHWRRFY